MIEGDTTMTVKELIDELSEFDPDLEIDFEFEEYSADGETWLLEPGVKFVFSKDDKETLIFNFRSIGSY
jgi:hypothetical protein